VIYIYIYIYICIILWTSCATGGCNYSTHHIPHCLWSSY